jgi:uncharacterized membrane protein YbhN (UPF0104 family)
VKQLLRLLVSISLLALLAWRADWTKIGAALAHLRIEFWFGAVVLYGLAQIVSALRWQQIARPLHFRQSLRQYISYYFISMFFNLFLPTSVGGDVIRALYLKGQGGSRLAAFLSVFLDRLSGLLVLLGLAGVALLFCPLELPRWVGLGVVGTITAALVAVASLPFLARTTARWDLSRRFVLALELYRHRPGVLLTSTTLSLVVQAINVVIVWLVGRAIAAPVPATYYWIVVPMVTLMTLLPISINGMGVREGGMILFLGPLGVDAATAMSLAFLWFSVFAAVSLLGAAIYLAGGFTGPQEQCHDGSINRDPDQGRARESKAAA